MHRRLAAFGPDSQPINAIRRDKGALGYPFNRSERGWGNVPPEPPRQRGHPPEGAGLDEDPKGPLFRTIGRGTGVLTRTPLPQANAYAMIGRRAAAAGIMTKLGNHSFRATGITAYLKNGGTLEKAAQMANHASTRTTQLYDRRREKVSLDEVERIRV